VDLDKVLRGVIIWAVHKLGVEEWLVLSVMCMYTDAKTVVRTVYGNTNGFEVGLKAGCPSCHPTNSVKALKAPADVHFRKLS